MPQGTAKKKKKGGGRISVYRWINREEIFHLKKVSNYLVSHTALKRSQLGNHSTTSTLFPKPGVRVTGEKAKKEGQ